MRFEINEKNKILAWCKNNELKTDEAKYSMMHTYLQFNSNVNDVLLDNRLNIENSVLSKESVLDDELAIAILMDAVTNNSDLIGFNKIKLEINYDDIILPDSESTFYAENNKGVFSAYWETKTSNGATRFLNYANKANYCIVLNRKEKEAYICYLKSERNKFIEDAKKVYEKWDKKVKELEAMEAKVNKEQEDVMEKVNTFYGALGEGYDMRRVYENFLNIALSFKENE